MVKKQTVQKFTPKYKLLFFLKTHSSQVTLVNKFLGHLKMPETYLLNELINALQ